MTLKESLMANLIEKKWPDYLLSEGNDKQQWLVLIKQEGSKPWQVRIYYGPEMDSAMYEQVKDMKTWETQRIFVEGSGEGLAIKI